MKGEVYPNRSLIHRNMGPDDSCDRCSGRGWHYRKVPDVEYEDFEEVFCDCPCGVERKRVEVADV